MLVKGIKVLEYRQKIEDKHIALFYKHYNAKKNDLKKKLQPGMLKTSPIALHCPFNACGRRSVCP